MNDINGNEVLTQADGAALPTVTYSTAIDITQSDAWNGATQLTSNSQELTPTSGHKFGAMVEVNSSGYPHKYAILKLNIG